MSSMIGTGGALVGIGAIACAQGQSGSSLTAHGHGCCGAHVGTCSTTGASVGTQVATTGASVGAQVGAA